MKKFNKKFIYTIFIASILFSGLPSFGANLTSSTNPVKLETNVEIRGARPFTYNIKNIKDLRKNVKTKNGEYSYVISKSTIALIEILGILAIIGALLFGIGHGFGRFWAYKKNPVELESGDEHKIYNIIMRMGHWLNALLIVLLILSGFMMHYAGPSHIRGFIHNFFGNILVVVYIIFVLYEIVTKDYKQFVVKEWEIKEGILKQALYYAIGIFKHEEHPYHMDGGHRLNPLQKVAYAGIMFAVLPLVVFTGFLLANPSTAASGLVAYIGMENMYIVFIIHLSSAFLMLAFLLGHIYLATTGDTVLQHFKVMISGKHREYKMLKDK